MKKIIFVCHGSICRSPAAEFIAKEYLKNIKKEKEYEIISCALTTEEIGNDIYPPMKATLLEFNIPFNKHQARLINIDDVKDCDYIFYMDEDNKFLLNNLFKDNSKFKPIFEFTPSIKEIEDPWYTGNYQKIINQIIVCIKDIFNNI